MAGIGFQLRKMIDKEHGIIHTIKSYGLAIIALNGPMVLCIVAVTIIQFMLDKAQYNNIMTNNILATITYSFVISSIVTGGYSLVLTRYVSDCIYMKDYSKVMASLYGGMIPSISSCLIISLCMVLFAGLNSIYGLCVLVLLSIVCIIWLEMIYLSAVKDNISISIGFLVGNTITIFMLIFLDIIPSNYSIIYIFISFITGFVVTAALLFVQIKRTFGESDNTFMKWTSYVKKYPTLTLTGLFYTIGLYFPCVYYRFSVGENFYNGFLLIKQEIDIPFFFAVLGIIPGLVYFVVRFETALHTLCNGYFSAILNFGTHEEIKVKMHDLIDGIKFYFSKLISVQITIMLGMILIPFFIDEINSSNFMNYKLYWYFVVGLSFTMLMYVAKIVLLYFDEKFFSFMIITIFMILVISLTIIFDILKIERGIAFIISSVLTLLISTILLNKFLRNIKNSVFMMKQMY